MHRRGSTSTRRGSCNQQVSIRPERFGALLYHFGTRRLSFLKSPALRRRRAVPSAEHRSARAACLACGVTPAELPRYGAALATLASSDMMIPADERGAS